MEMDLDLDDLDFGDRVKEFLEHKLKEIKNANESTLQKIAERKQYLTEKLHDDNLRNEKSECSVSFKWIKIFNKKYVMYFEVQNNLDQPIKDPKPLLKWSPSQKLIYETIIYNIIENSEIKECTKDTCQNVTNNIIKSNYVTSRGCIVILMNIPNYLESLEYTISGKILGKRKEKDILVDLPSVKISSEDITNKEVCGISLLTGNVDNALTAILTSNKTDFVFIFPSDWTISLDSTFEIHCSLTKINIPNCCKKYVMANRISPLFDDTIIAVHNSKYGSMVWTTIYSNSKNALLSMLHHLHKHIPGLMVIPEELYEYYDIKNCVTNGNIPEVLKEFKKSIQKEMDLIETSAVSAGRKNVSKFRSKLADLERNTDFLYLKICELNNYNMG